MAVFNGTLGDDTWSGGAANDVVSDGGGGSDTFNTGAGNDTVTVTSGVHDAGSAGHDVVDLGADNDLLIIDYSGLQNDLWGTGGFFTLSTTVDAQGVASGTLYGNWNYGPNALNLEFSGVERFTVIGSADRDSITTGAGDDTLAGGDGDDTLNSGAGKAFIDGGAGKDLWAADLSAFTTAITIDLNASQGEVQQTGAGTLTNIEALTLTTGSGNDTLITLAGGATDDTIITGAGNDTVVVASGANNADGAGHDVVDLGTGNDLLIIDYSGLQNDLWGTGGFFTLSATVDGQGVASGLLQGNWNYGPNRTNLEFSGVERFTVIGSAGGDSIATGDGNDTLAGGDGDDTLNSGKGAAFIDGGIGKDRWTADLSALTTGVIVDLNASQGMVQQTGAGILTNIEALTLTTGSGNDTLVTLAGGATDDTITTGAGNDTVTVTSGVNNADGAGHDVVNMGDGNDDLLIIDYSGLQNDLWGTGGFFTLSTTVDAQGAPIGTLQGNWNSGPNRTNLEFSGVERFTVIGSAGGDSIATGDGNDTLIGGDGDDTLNSGKGAAFIDGGAGKDLWAADLSALTTAVTVDLNASQGVVRQTGAGTLTNIEALTLTTGTGDDTLVTLAGGATNDTLATGDGNDTVVVTSGAHNAADAGQDVVNMDGGNDDHLIIDYSGLQNDLWGTGGFFTLSTTVDALGVSSGTLQGNWNSGPNVTNLVFSGVERFTVIGSAGGDSITTGDGNDTLAGGDGDDTLNSGKGTATIDGGAGKDLWAADLSALTTAVTVDLNTSQGVVQQTGAGTLTNIEALTLTTGSGNDTLITLASGATNDTLNTGGGNDTVVVTSGVNDAGGAGQDVVNMDGGNDDHLIIDYSGLQNDPWGTGGFFTLSTTVDALGVSSGTLQGNWNSGPNVTNLVFSGVERFTVTGSADHDTITTGAGNDFLEGGGSWDTLNGGDGFDTASYQHAQTGITLNSNDQGYAGDANGDSLSNIEKVIGSEFDDSIFVDTTLGPVSSGSTIQEIHGGGGNDTIGGRQGISDWAYGDAGDDFFWATGSAPWGAGTAGNGDHFDGGSGSDTVYYSYSDGGTMTLPGTNSVVSKGATVNLSNPLLNAGWAAGDTYVSIENIRGSVNADTLTGDSGSNILYGNGGYDKLYGLGGDDILEAGEGMAGTADPTANPDGDDDYIDGGDGSDTVSYAESGAHNVVVNLANPSLNTADAEGDIYVSIENVIGSSLNDHISGDQNDNVLEGGAGADLLDGAGGNDTASYAHAASTDAATNRGVTVAMQDAASYVLQSPDAAAAGDALGDTFVSIENLQGSRFDDTLSGNSAANRISGDAGNDILSGLQGGAGLGLDTLLGGAGDDTYVVDRLGEVFETTTTTSGIDAGGIDTVGTTVAYTLDQFVENLVLMGPDAILGTGNALENTLIGNDQVNELMGLGGNDYLKGGKGADTLKGGIGDDTYSIQKSDDAIDTLIENPNEGTDWVRSEVSWTLAGNLENLMLSGTDAINGTGNELANTLSGNDQANQLLGQGGNDILAGGKGADTLKGGIGDDTYVISKSDDATDTLIENLNEGTDVVVSEVSWTLAGNLENLTLSGTDAIKGTGNSLANTLTGNGTNDTLAGGGGNDTYVVGTSDTVMENAGAGIDTVQSWMSYTLADNVENLVLNGTAMLNGTGNGLANNLTGNGAANWLDGAAGADTLTGGMGDDIYTVDNAGDRVVENAGAGTDTVLSWLANYTLAVNTEKLQLLEAGNLNGSGNALNNTLIGNSAANALDGGAGADTLYGGAGDDTFVVDNTGDTVVENAGEGTDTVQSILSQTLAANVENLALTGTAAIDGTGNGLANTLTGNGAANRLSGLGGADTLQGGTGNDTYVVGDANDSVVENAGAGTDTVESSVSYTLADNVENLVLTSLVALKGTGNALDNVLTGSSAANTLAGGAGNDTYVVDNAGDSVAENANEGIDTVQSSVSYTLMANLENLTLTGAAAINGTGNSFANVLQGNGAANRLDGGIGADTLQGGAGNDTYVVDNAGDSVVENANQGIDTVQSAMSQTLAANVENLILTGTAALTGTGNGLANALTGNDAANRLNGGIGVDTLVGGAGNDTYVVDNAGDVVVEQASQGTDTVQSWANYTLGANLENLRLMGTTVLNGTGNSLANAIIGNSAANLLDGGAGADTLTGGDGDDTYGVDNTGDVVVEQAGQGIDTVQSAVSYTLGANLENLALTGTAALTGTGNALDNVLTGNSATNTLAGGGGNDTYIVDNAGDSVVENANEGIDTVQSSVSYTLAANVENLTLTGTMALNGTGNTLANTLQGNGAANRLNGLAGADTLAGGVGNDTYVVDNAGDSVTENANAGIDTVQSAVSYTLAANVENLTLTGTTALNGTGNALGNALTGNGVANRLNGLGGADTLTGGAGDDTYVVDNAGDSVTENANEGSDTVESTMSYTLSANVENLTLTGTAAINGTGNDFANTLQGNSGANRLDGGAGVDTLAGGNGNDTYGVDNVGDVVAENANQGSDTVESAVAYTLGANLENLTLTGTAALDGTGNYLANTLTGNSAANRLGGAAGADTLAGGAGDDTYAVDNAGDVVAENANEGGDTVVSTVSYTLAANVENLTLTGTAALNGTGNALANTLTGNAGNNVLNGWGGADTLTGGDGNDTYVVDNSGDVVTETNASTTQIDTVQTWVSHTLGANVESLRLLGATALNGTGNGLANVLYANSGNNVLDGGTGFDTVSYQYGATAAVTASLAVTAAQATGGSGSDTLVNVESLIGSAYADTLTGNAGNNVLNGGVGNDMLIGGAGVDSLTGGLGADIFVFDNKTGADTVTDFVSGADKLKFSQAVLPVGDGDTLLEGAVALVGPDGFAPGAELVIATQDLTGGITTSAAATAIGSATSAYAAGAHALFAVDNGSQSAVYYFTAANANAAVEANELVLLATLNATPGTVLADYGLMA